MSARTLDDLRANWDGFSIPGVAVRAENSVTEVRALVDVAVREDLVLVLVFHDLRERPREYEWTPSQFKELVGYVAQIDARERTIAEFYAAP